MKRGLIALARPRRGGRRRRRRPAPPVAPDTLAVPGAMQWLYGSGEGAATGIQAYHAFRDYAVAAARHRPEIGVVLAAGATLDGAALRAVRATSRWRWFSTSTKPHCSTLGYEYDQAATECARL